MKNFPHQFNDLGKLTGALGVLNVLQGSKQSVADDGVFGEALANAGIYTFRGLGSVADRLAAEKLKPTGNQGFRTAAREMGVGSGWGRNDTLSVSANHRRWV